MKKTIINTVLPAAFALLFIGSSSFQPKNKWTSLLDINLSQWEVYQSYRHTTSYNGNVPSGENGKTIEPIGYNKNEANVFSVVEDSGEPALKISGEIYGCVYTKQEYENYHLKLKVKWGVQKWEPRKDLLKDSGLLYHSVGKAGVDYWRSWMLAQEFQIMEGHMGDYWSIANSAIDIRAFIPEGDMNTVASARQPFQPVGAGKSVSSFCLRSEDHESPEGEWTNVELVCFEDKSLHIVNGHVVMVLQNSRYVVDGQEIPLTKGKIQLQSEAAEVFYKEIQIRSIDEMPKKYAAYFK
ncbi:3-keto-disaccharide hydrolase [Pontibacter harenae]|uniref:3-keto-disaccharide hydrolase n=1 Tax=Pontibacter harenae TaxID=2894083 RepID=UPI001E4703D9|nr:DUF1080 domain-containing protein [Pontibacter harenae]MCC9167310.1 DUF1080 domain-containing protein [Pontibacter harenae]